MSKIMIKFPQDQASELKGLINEGLHCLGNAMRIAEGMYESHDYGDRYSDPYAGRYANPVPPVPTAPYEHSPYMGERNYHYPTHGYHMPH